MRKVELRLFGAFRKYSESAKLEISLPERATVADLRALLPVALAGEGGAASLAGLVGQSAIASESEILLDHREIPEGGIAILPPVCGG